MWWVVVPFGAVALCVSAYNLATWPRGRPEGRFRGSISVLIPARDEVGDIEACVRAAVAEPVDEVVVYDDRSTDGTAETLRLLSAELPKLRVVAGGPLPRGWVGKPHACHQLARHARGDLLLFVDADTTLSGGGVGRLVSLLEDHGADIVTAVPHQRTGSAVEALLLPLLHLTYTSWLPLSLVHRARDPRFLAANGQVLAVRREALEALGGFASIASEVVDDMALCRRAKQAGRTVLFADGTHIARTRMYRSAREVWEGFSKNIYEGLGSPVALIGAIALYGLAFVAPYVALGAGLLGVGAALLPGAVGVTVNAVLRGALAVRFGHAAWSVAAHPLAVGLAGAIALNSWRWSRRGAIRWRGRVYAARGSRAAGEVVDAA